MHSTANPCDQVTQFIQEYAAQHGRQSPSLQEMAAALGIGKATANSYVQQLIAAGRAIRRDGKLWLTQPPWFRPPDP